MFRSVSRLAAALASSHAAHAHSPYLLPDSFDARPVTLTFDEPGLHRAMVSE